MPAYSKRLKPIVSLSRATVTGRPNGHAGMVRMLHHTTGESGDRVFDDPSSKEKNERVVGYDSSRGLCDTLTIGQTVLVSRDGCEISATVLKNMPFSREGVQLCLHDGRNTIITARQCDVKVVENGAAERTKLETSDKMEGMEEEDAWKERLMPLVIDIPGATKFALQDYEDTEELMAAAVLTSLSLSPVLPQYEASNDGLEAFEDSVFNDSILNTTSRDKAAIKRRTKTRRRKNSFRTIYQCTWPRCGKILSNSATIIRHVRESHLGPKKQDDDGFSDGEEEFYFTEIEEDIDEPARHSSEGSLSPPVSRFSARRCRSLSDPSRPTQPLVSPRASQPHVDDNFIWSLRTSTHGGRCKTKRPVHQAPHLVSRKGRGDGRKCRKVYGMENRHLWCTQCRWKKACIKFVD